MNKVYVKLCLLILLFFSISVVFGFPSDTQKVSPSPSYKNENRMFQRTVWRVVDFEDPRNQKYFAKGNELTTFILNYAQNGKLTVYKNDSLGTALSLESLYKALCYNFEDDSNSNVSREDLYLGSDLYEIELKQEMFFDKHYSQFVRKNTAITLYIPFDHPLNAYGYNYPIGSFDYDEVMALLKKDEKAIQYNPYNQKAGINMAIGFELGDYYGHIVKVNNPQDLYLVDQYNGNETAAWWAGLQWEYDLLEWEYLLWSKP